MRITPEEIVELLRLAEKYLTFINKEYKGKLNKHIRDDVYDFVSLVALEITDPTVIEQPKQATKNGG